MATTTDEVAHELLEVVPLVMRTIRTEMRRHRAAEALGAAVPDPPIPEPPQGASLSVVAEHLGLTSPTTSDLIDYLLEHGLVDRNEDPADRRRVTLNLTQLGTQSMESARQSTQGRLAEVLASLAPEQREVVAGAMQILRPLFTPGVAPAHGKER